MTKVEFFDTGLDEAWHEGWRAAIKTDCPYGVTQLGMRCAWLAAHRDRYGSRAA